MLEVTEVDNLAEVWTEAVQVLVSNLDKDAKWMTLYRKSQLV